ncbi:MAG: DNA mismatch repair endonuclease MutL [Flavobacteriales bacterium]|nr:DNA mismatch repair endonuclease MutL [Flavobacteriales bacterium]
MSNIIQLLPDVVANQIAAGEVIQRPASTVKELMENAIDAEALTIQLIIKDAGKSLIQVIDDGKGMSEVDLRMSIERHATSKIKLAADLFALNTFGFRGEALASISAISHMVINSKPDNNDLGSQLIVEGGKVKSQEPDHCAKGTCISIKNLFYNVPARRNFLKSDAVETKHIIEEFLKVALINPDKQFELHHNNSEIYHLPSGPFRQRIVDIFGKGYNQKLVPVNEDTNILKISGFIGKPEFAKKTRGEQYFFVNNRYIKSSYLHHAVNSAYDQLLPHKNHPSYFLTLEIDPSLIDINIHPTKNEIKFENEREIYAIVMATVKNSLGKYNIVPSIDFEMEADITPNSISLNHHIVEPKISVDTDYNPFSTDSSNSSSSNRDLIPKSKKSPLEKSNIENWGKMFAQQEVIVDNNTDLIFQPENEEQGFLNESWQSDTLDEKSTPTNFQVLNKYIITESKDGIIIIDQQIAFERVIYEKQLQSLSTIDTSSQQLLFPINFSLPAGDAVLFQEIRENLSQIGFEIENFGKNSYVIQARPSSIKDDDVSGLIETVLEDLKNYTSSVSDGYNERIARSMAKRVGASKYGKLDVLEINNLVAQLFSCDMPHISPDGKNIFKSIATHELASMLTE